ncbi:hypothetical protein D046_6119 [Vibrio parahaemolyticus V-223/04]|nr:hypothetical protein D046_6119 [Vibrio parahaemolyticus V-223/04]
MKLEAHGVIFIQQCNIKSLFIMMCKGERSRGNGNEGAL